MTGRIVSVRVGRVREWPRPEWDHAEVRTWRTGYVKDEVAGPVRAGELGLAGDEQFDRRVHGGPHMAVLAYANEHYATWRLEPGLGAMGPGGFGENLTTEGFDETTVCIGDRFEAGTVAFEVSQPRGPCANISRHWNAPTLLARATETARIGWYLRVTREGELAAGDPMRRVASPFPRFTVEAVFRARIDLATDPALVRALSECPALSPDWRELLAKRLA